MRIDRVDTRAKLKLRRDPYWLRIVQGRYVGFRRMSTSTPGTWLARYYDGETYKYQRLNVDESLPEKNRYAAAKTAAEVWFLHLDRGGSTGASSVKAACAVYVEHLKIEKSEAAAADAKGRFKRLIDGDPLGPIELQKLAPRHVVAWKGRVLAAGGSRGSYNRNATALRAALNLAYKRREVSSDHAWLHELVPFTKADGQRTLYLDRAARRLLIENAPAEVRPLLTALALVPMRPGELVNLRVEHLDAAQRILNVPGGKTSARPIPLGAEAMAHFKECATDKLPGAWLIARKDGGQWDRFAWGAAIREAVAAAKLPKATCAYTLRHSSITDLVTGNPPETDGLDLFTVAKIAGTSVLMIERHYGHLQREHARTAMEGLSMGDGAKA